MGEREKFCLHPGYVTSKHDGDRHYIGAEQLASLYGVDMKDCIVSHSDKFGGFYHDTLYVHLHPRYDGNYSLPAPADSRGDK